MVTQGVLVDYIGQLQFLFLNDKMNDVGFAAFVQILGDEIDCRKPDEKVSTLLYCPSGVDLGATRRKAVADLLSSRKAIVSKSTLAFALVTESAQVRGAIQALFWMAPAQYPTYFESTMRDGLTKLALTMPSIDPVGTEYSIQRLILRNELKMV